MNANNSDGPDNELPLGDEAVLIDCRIGLERFVREHHDRLVSVLSRRLSIDDAKEVAQDVYLSLLTRGGPRTSDHLRHYTFRTAMNRANDRHRRRRILDRILTLLLGGSDNERPDTETETLAAEELERLLQLAHELPEPYRKAFLMIKVYNAPREKVARDMAVTERTVTRYVSHALAYIWHRREGHSKDEAKEFAKL